MLRQIDPNDHEKLREYLDSRSEDISTEVILKVTEILHAVKKEKDAAIKRYTKQFDGIDLEDYRVREEEINEAAAQADPKFVESMRQAKANIEYFCNL